LAGYFGTYRLAFVIGNDQILVDVTIGDAQNRAGGNP